MMNSRFLYGPPIGYLHFKNKSCSLGPKTGYINNY